MTTQEKRGKVKNLKGRLKEALAILWGGGASEREGARQRAEGAVEESAGKARRKTGELVEEVAEAIKE